MLGKRTKKIYSLSSLTLILKNSGQVTSWIGCVTHPFGVNLMIQLLLLLTNFERSNSKLTPGRRCHLDPAACFDQCTHLNLILWIYRIILATSKWRLNKCLWQNSSTEKVSSWTDNFSESVWHVESATWSDWANQIRPYKLAGARQKNLKCHP